MRVIVTVLLLFGDDAELVTPEHDTKAPLRMQAAEIARDAGLSETSSPSGSSPPYATAAATETSGSSTTPGYEVRCCPRAG